MQEYFSRQVEAVVKDSILPSVTSEHAKIIRSTRFTYPATMKALLSFYTDGRTVTLATPSLLFLHDLVVAYIWQNVNGCRPTVLSYVSMLKYWEKRPPPRRRIEHPIYALGLPTASPRKLGALNPEFTPQLQRVFYGTLLFLTAHELGHVVLGHKGGSSIEKEIAADNFAFDIFARDQIDPSGIMVFFLLTSPLVSTDAELKAEHLDRSHPLNGRRVASLGRRLTDNPKQYYPDAGPNDPRVPLLKAYGTRLIGIGQGLDNISLHEYARDTALSTNPDSLRGCQK